MKFLKKKVIMTGLYLLIIKPPIRKEKIMTPAIVIPSSKFFLCCIFFFFNLGIANNSSPQHSFPLEQNKCMLQAKAAEEMKIREYYWGLIERNISISLSSQKRAVCIRLLARFIISFIATEFSMSVWALKYFLYYKWHHASNVAAPNGLARISIMPLIGYENTST